MLSKRVWPFVQAGTGGGRWGPVFCRGAASASYRGGWQLVAWLHYRSARQVREYVYVVFECWLVTLSGVRAGQ
jgi:hypothetical protein